MSKIHFNLEQRKILEQLLKKNFPISAIAEILGYSRSAIYQELKRNRNCKNKYCADTANYKATLRRKQANKIKYKQDPIVVEYIQKNLKELYSPEQIWGRMKIDKLPITVCFKTIYRWLEEGRRVKHKSTCLKGYSQYLRLRRAGKSLRPKIPSKRGGKQNLPPIETRPEITSVGHWEADLVQGYNRSGYLLTLVDKMSGVTLIEYCARKSVEEVNAGLNKICSLLPKKYRQSITFDRGKEFYGYEKIEENFGVSCYFCNPSCPHERGLNENTNGLLRQIFPKKRDYSTISREEITKAISNLNNRPRKRFQFKTPQEVLLSQGIRFLYNFT